MKNAAGPLDRIVTVAIFILLVVALVVGIGANISQVGVELGEQIWPDYAADLRSERAPPDCDLEALDAQLEQCPAAGAVPGPTPEGDDPFEGEDPFGDKDPFGDEDPFAEPEPAPDEADPFGDEDPFAEPEPAEPAPADPFGDEDPFAEDGSAEPSVNCTALHNLRDRCARNWEEHSAIEARTTPALRAFRSVETAIGELAKFGYERHLLVLLVLLGGFQTTRHRSHIALRDPANLTEHRISQGMQLLAHLVWLVSCFFDWRVQQEGSAEIDNPALPVIWGLGLAILAGANLWSLARPPRFDRERAATATRALMVVPLYAWMALIGAVWFQLAERHVSGQAIFLHKFVGTPSIYLGIGLYIWAGMMLAQTRMARLVFQLLVPWKLPPNMLAWLVVVLAAIPTAYSGASGIFVIAAGAVIFESLRDYGARPRVALAATAMSGSLGVVLRPCLVVVLISVLNIDVESKDLFYWGRYVFALTAALFGIAMLARNEHRFEMPPVRAAIGGTWAAFVPLVPYLAIGGGVVALYYFALGTPVTEHTAPFVLPGLMLALVAWDRLQTSEGPRLWPALTEATSEGSHHIGALLFVMAGSVGIGGVVERSEAMSLLPEDLGSPFTAMAFLVFVMVLVGMTMDALGAVILVSVTLKHVATANGIDPVHFWMMVLCAFELGYLTPPVALNHLLARQVIGAAADMEDVPANSWFHRYEHVVVPMLVMGTALLLVAFVPLLL